MNKFLQRSFFMLLLLIGFAYTASAQTVYTTKTGAKYHNDGCRYLSKSKIQTTVKDAKASGYTACKVCKPSTLAAYRSQDLHFFASTNSLIDFKTGTRPFGADMLKGVVCFKDEDCDMMIICLENGNYSVAEDYFDKCSQGDVLIGEMQSFGFKQVYHLARETEIKIYVEDWETSEDSAIEEFKEQCN